MADHVSRRRKLPFLSWLLILIAAASLLTGTVTAYLSYATDPVTNTFRAAQAVDPTVNETFEDNVKSDVSVNVGNTSYSVYVRAAVIVTWKDSDGDVLGKVPVEGTDYEISFNDEAWFVKGDYWYHKAAVNSQGNTSVLIKNCQKKEGASVPTGYNLNVEILAQTIQALGKTDGDATANPPVDPIPAVTDAWKVFVDQNGYLTPTDPAT